MQFPKLRLIKNEHLQSYGISLILVLINLFIGWLVRNSGVFYYSNKFPFGVNIDLVSTILIVGFVTYGLWQFGYLKRYPVLSILILTGVWSNYLEKWLFGGYVADYISFFFSYINLADIQIWIGLIALNIQIWFLDKNRSDPQELKQ